MDRSRRDRARLYHVLRHKLIAKLTLTLPFTLLNDRNGSTGQIHFVCGILSLVTTEYINKTFDCLY
jgi:hypothetical protein